MGPGIRDMQKTVLGAPDESLLGPDRVLKLHADSRGVCETGEPVAEVTKIILKWVSP